MWLDIAIAVNLLYIHCAGAVDCDGGIVTVNYLNSRINGKSCTKIKGGLYFLQSDWTYKQHLLNAFENVINITGPLHFAATKGLGDVECFDNVKEIHPHGPAIVLLNNVGLSSLALTSLEKVGYSKYTKAVILHNNEGFDVDEFLGHMKAKGMVEKEFLSTSRREFMNTIWAVLFFLTLLLILLCLLGFAVYRTAEEIGEYYKLKQQEKDVQRYRPPESRS
ncbi:hypothetical protein RB195_011651 [Necator americanus]|uniref:Receptor L-domain domain-containing protein n=1 Tax=Necator americanus TaxID=51031 RepID=A0ABR1D3H4_NECAM